MSKLLTSSSCFIFNWAISNWLFAVSFSRSKISSGGQWLSSREFSDKSACRRRKRGISLVWLSFNYHIKKIMKRVLKFKTDANKKQQTRLTSNQAQFEIQKDLLRKIKKLFSRKVKRERENNSAITREHSGADFIINWRDFMLLMTLLKLTTLSLRWSVDHMENCFRNHINSRFVVTLRSGFHAGLCIKQQ